MRILAECAQRCHDKKETARQSHADWFGVARAGSGYEELIRERASLDSRGIYRNWQRSCTSSRQMRLLLISCAVGAMVQAQQIRLSTRPNGEVLYVVLDAPRRGVEEPVQGRIYTFTRDGLALSAERTREVLANEPGRPQVTNYFWYTAAETTGPGGILALTAERQCLSGRNCVGVPLTETILTGAVERTEPGRVQFSPNGRWLVRFREQSLGTAQGALIDLTTGSERPYFIGPGEIHNGRIVADDGSLVLNRGGALSLLRLGAAESTIFTQYNNELAETPAISADGRFAVYASAWVYPYHAYKRLRIARFDPLRLSTLVEGFANYYEPVLSHDGRRVLFLSDDPLDNSGWLAPPQAHVIEIDGSSLRRLTDDPYGISSAILSGDGRIAYALSKSGRLVRVDVDSGLQTELLPPFIQVFNMTQIVAGSRVDFEAYDEAELRIYLGEQKLPVMRHAPGKFSFVVPFELAGQKLRLRAEAALPDGPFEPRALDQDVTVHERLPRVYDLPQEYGGPGAYGMRFSRVYDEGYTRLITPFEPAAPGTVVNVLATGLGPVEPQTGELTGTLACRWYQPAAAVPIAPIFAGLHPDEAGVYQLRFRLPENIPPRMGYEGALQIACAFPGSITSDLVMLIAFSR